MDTELANLLGQNLRDLKLDIMQRMGGFGAGLLANRPTPDSGADANFTGVTYWATDTGQFFNWTGSAWIDITPSFGGLNAQHALDPTAVTVSAPASQTTLNTVTLTGFPTSSPPHSFRIDIRGCINTVGGFSGGQSILVIVGGITVLEFTPTVTSFGDAITFHLRGTVNMLTALFAGSTLYAVANTNKIGTTNFVNVTNPGGLTQINGIFPTAGSLNIQTAVTSGPGNVTSLFLDATADFII